MGITVKSTPCEFTQASKDKQGFSSLSLTLAPMLDGSVFACERVCRGQTRKLERAVRAEIRGLGGSNKSTDAVNMKAEYWGGRGLADMGVGGWGQWRSG